MPDIIPQLGAQNMNFLKQFAKMAQQEAKVDEDIPELVGDTNFEDIADS